MALTAELMREEASSWDREALLRIWSEIEAGDDVGWPAGKRFEYLIIRAFELEAVPIRWPYSVLLKGGIGIMEQFDGVVYLDQQAFLVESKNLSEPAAIEAVAKLRFRLERRPPATMAVLFSTSDFSLPTELFAQFASPMNVLLWGRSDVEYALNNMAMASGLREKMRHAIEFGIPMFSLGRAV